MRLSDEPLIDADRIARRVAELGQTISDDFAGRDLLVLPVLKGALVFCADLLRRLTIPVALDFVRMRSYRGAESSGRIEFTCLPDEPLENRHVLVVEDIVDTGATAVALLDRLRAERPASIALCALLDKPARRVAPVAIDYAGFPVDDRFIVGYGLDYNQQGRELPDIRGLEAD